MFKKISRWSWSLAPLLGLAAGLLAASSCGRGGFECGTYLDGDVDKIRACTRPGEQCVCATRSCAEEVSKKVCESGFRYVDAPFSNVGSKSAPRPCVDSEDLDSMINQREDLKICPSAVGTDQPMSSTASGSEASTTSGTSTGTTSTTSTAASGTGSSADTAGSTTP